MEFNKKLQELRKQKGLTQEELAEQLYVSRTAVSKWESGRGYPNIESMKAIAKLFSVTVDELLSSDEILTIAEENQKLIKTNFKDLIFGLVDIAMSLILFLPLFAIKTDVAVNAVSLLAFSDGQPYLKIAYFTVVIGTIIMGIATLSLQNFTAKTWTKNKTNLSLSLGVISCLLFMISLQPYAAVFAFSLLVIKVTVLLKR